MRRLFTAFLLLLPVAAFAAAPCKFQAPRNLKINLAGISAVQIELHSHNMHITGIATSQGFTMTGHACASDAVALKGLQVTQRRVGNQLLLDVGGNAHAAFTLFGSSYAYLDLNVQLPARMPVALHVGSGDATVTNVQQLQGSVNSGDLHVRRVLGKYSASVGSGDIDASDLGSLEIGSMGSGDFKAERIKGDVKIGIIGSGDVLLRHVGGSVRADTLGSGGLNVKDVGGDLSLGAKGSGDVNHARVKGKLNLPRDTD
jgi:hypothetical protein